MCEENGVKHLFSAPYHPQSNGQAERFVDTFKRTVNKAKGEGKFDSALHKFLLNYRSTPSVVLGGKTPAELFIGREFKTRLTLIKPTEKREETAISECDEDPAKIQFDRKHGAVNREFSIEDSVYYRPNAQFNWTEGRISEKVGKTNYAVTLVNGRVVRAHANQLRKRYSKPVRGWDHEDSTYDLLAQTFLLPPDDHATPRNTGTTLPPFNPPPRRLPERTPPPRARSEGSPPRTPVDDADLFQDAVEDTVDITSEAESPDEVSDVADSPPRRPTGRRIRPPVRFSPEAWQARRRR